MCSLIMKDERETFALKYRNKSHSEIDPILNGKNVDQATAHLVCKERSVDYWMKNSRITVGRSSSKRGSADVDMGQSTFISRNHLEIYTTDAKFYALVTGKNGIFISDKFYKKGGTAFELPAKCIIRFPSTDIKINFEMFLQHSHSSQSEKSLNTSSYSNLLKSNSHSSISSPGTCMAIMDGNICQISEEVVTQTQSQTPDSTQMDDDQTDISDMYNKTQFNGIMKNNQNNNQSNNVINTNGTKHTKPPYSYAQLIVQAISSQEDHQLTLSGIYNYITKLYPFYRHGDKGWQNSIRHNLSLNRYFVKVPRSQEEAGKGCFWKIDSNSEQVLISQAFRKRRQRPVPYCRTNSLDAVTSGSMDASSHIEDGPWEASNNDDNVFSYLSPHDDIKAFAATIPLNGTAFNPTLNGKRQILFKTSGNIASNQDVLYMNGERLKLDASHFSTTQAPVSTDHKKAIVFSTQPKTIVLRSTNNNKILSQVNNHNLSLPVANQLIKLSYAPPKTISNTTSPHVTTSSTPILPSFENIAENSLLF